MRLNSRETDTWTALQRFGLGASVGDLKEAASEPRGFVTAQLAGFAVSSDESSLPSMATALEWFVDRRRNLNEQKKARIELLSTLSREEREKLPPLKASANIPTIGSVQSLELDDRIVRAIDTHSPLIERLALHWSNVFTVSANAGFLGMFAGAFEREAIRPHMLKKFEDLLLAAALHPAMLFYLDNRNSTGPGSKIGRKGVRGLNENLGREILELHTLGTKGGYVQADVIALSRMLTGWTIDLAENTRLQSRTRFDPDRHEPGEQVLLGKRYPDTGPDQAKAALRDLASHPATAEHVSRRMVEHFVGMPAPASLVRRLASTFVMTGGDLRAVTSELVQADDAWAPSARKLRPPMEIIFGAARLFGHRLPALKPIVVLKAMGQPFQRATSPKGWPEEDDAWASPDSVKSRLDWAIAVAYGPKSIVDAKTIVATHLGPYLSSETREHIGNAESPSQALALLLMSPEFQRR